MTPTWLNPSATEYSDIKVDNIKHHAITHTVTVAAVTIFAPQVPAQSKSTRTGNTDALSNHGMLAWCTWPLLGPILSPLSKNSTINIPAFLTPKSCSQVLALLLSIPSWKKGQKVMTWSWHQHDWIRVQLNTATSKWTTSSTMLPHTVTVAAVTIFAPQVPAQSKSTRTGNTDALSNHGMLAWCTWPLLGPILSPLSKNSTINIPAFLTPKSCSQVLALLLSIPSWKKGQKVMTWSWHQHDWIRVQLNTATSKWTTSSTMLSHTQSQSLLSQSLHHRSPHKANQPGRVIRMHYQTMECLHDALDHCLVQFFLHCLKIPRSTSLHSWHLNPAHKCLHCYCQF